MTKRKFLTGAIIACIIAILLLTVYMMWDDALLLKNEWLSNDSKLTIGIVPNDIGENVTIYYLSAEKQEMSSQACVFSDEEIFYAWRNLSNVFPEAVINRFHVDYGYEAEVDYGGSKVSTFVSIDPIVEIDLNTTSYQDSWINQNQMATLIKTLEDRYARTLGKLVVTMEGDVIYEK